MKKLGASSTRDQSPGVISFSNKTQIIQKLISTNFQFEQIYNVDKVGI
jgi:hypothetical protein